MADIKKQIKDFNLQTNLVGNENILVQRDSGTTFRTKVTDVFSYIQKHLPQSTSGGGSNNWNDIINKPTTLNGYGITDGVHSSSFISHTSNTSNPHNVTKTQVGLSNVDNTSDINKPVSTLQASADTTVFNNSKSYTDTVVNNLQIKDYTTAGLASLSYVNTQLSTKQNTLISGTNIKTINGNSVLGSGNIAIVSNSYTSGSGITLTGNQFSLNTTFTDNRYYTKTQSEGRYIKGSVINTPNVLFNTPVSNATTAGIQTFNLTLKTQSANTFLAGGTAGTITPIFRKLTLNDMPVFTGYASGAGLVSSTDTAFTAIQKLDGNLQNYIDKSKTPQVKNGGLTLGYNLTKPNDNWITLGTSVTNGATYSTPTALQLNLTLLNYGVSGSTSNDLVNHYTQIPTLNSGNQDQYRLLSIEHGINDSAQGVPLATFRANIIACIANAKSKGWTNDKILIISGNYCTNAPMVTTLESYANEAIAIAIEQGVQYYDAYHYTLNNGAGTLLSDGVHPTVEGGLVYARGLIASMIGGMEITNGLTVVNGITAGGPLKLDGGITTLGSIKTGNGAGNNPANTVNGDVIVPYTAGLITQYSQTGIIAKFTPIEDTGSSFSTTIRNYVENGNINFYTSRGVRGSQGLALKINTNGIIDTPFGINSSDNINITFSKSLQYNGAWTNKLTISESNGSTTISNGYSGGEINFNVSNGVTNASNLALKIFNNKNLRAFGDLQVDGNLNIGFNQLIQYLGAYTNKIIPSNGAGAVVLSSGYSTGTIDFNVSNGVTNASNLAMRINNDMSASFLGGISVTNDIGVGFNKALQYVGAYTNKLTISDASGNTIINNGYVSGTIDFNVSNGVTNASNLAMRINNNGTLTLSNDLVLNTVGKGIKIKEGVNARMGTGTLVAGTLTIANTTITANTRIFLTASENGVITTPLRVTARVSGTSFTVGTATNTDTVSFVWELKEGI